MMEILHTEKAPAVGPYSQAVEANGLSSSPASWV